MDFFEEYLPAAKGIALKMFTRNPAARTRTFAEHRHIAFEVGYFKTGRGVYTTAKKDYTIKPGDIFVFRSNEPHWISEVEKTEKMELINLQFEPRLLWAGDYAAFDYIRLFMENNPDFVNRLTRENENLPLVREAFLKILEELNRKNSEYQMMVKMHLLTIFVLLGRHFDYKDTADAAVLCKNNVEAIEQAMNFLYAHLTEDISLSDLAREANMSETYFSTIFKKVNGVSPWGYITAKRVELAASYLIRNTGTVLEIALKCGFNNTANFNKIFKKITGLTPREYRLLGHAALE